jgi:16S rRNA (guanine1207-N2)-methyltransferase
VIHANIRDINFVLESRPDLFSPRRVDAGTLAMLACIDFNESDKVLDLGCGYGVVGIYAAKLLSESSVFLLDADPVAVETATKNAISNGLPNLSITQSDGFHNFHEAGFTKILSNPPYHSDFSVPKHFILKGFNRLEIGGQLWFVTKRDKWYRNKLRAVFGNAKSQQVDDYVVISATKMHVSYARTPR